jgi:ABC-type Fe3+ transport system permease subunit
MMASSHKPKKKQRRQSASLKEQATQQVAARKKEGTVRKAFTVIICVVVALGLMLPITGIGVMSCSSAAVSQETLP